ncbi:hypothetical protein GF337_13515, partial [candidate division KSB1 bacterium]|nr:hypothetical protein [candidate division KSB1 bacterium]
MKYILPFIVLSLGDCGTRLGKQPHEKMDNYQIFNRLAEQVVLSTIDSSGISCNNTNVYLKTSDSEDSNGWFIENWYIRLLQEMQCDSISTLPDVGKNKNQNSIQVDFKIINLNVNYISQDTFWKSNPVRREIEVKLW